MKKQPGFIAITTVLILLSVVLGIAATVTYLSIGEGQSGLALFKGEENLSFVEGCVEDSLQKIRSDPLAFSVGTSTFSIPEGTCSIEVTSANPNWDITLTSSITNYQRKIRVKFSRAGNGITLTSWKEI